MAQKPKFFREGPPAGNRRRRVVTPEPPVSLEEERAVLRSLVSNAARLRVRGAARMAVCMLPVTFTDVEFFVGIQRVDGMAARDLKGNAGPLVSALVASEKLIRFRDGKLTRGWVWGTGVTPYKQEAA